MCAQSVPAVAFGSPSPQLAYPEPSGDSESSLRFHAQRPSVVWSVSPIQPTLTLAAVRASLASVLTAAERISTSAPPPALHAAWLSGQPCVLEVTQIPSKGGEGGGGEGGGGDGGGGDGGGGEGGGDGEAAI